jgi:hypothetical protein
LHAEHGPELDTNIVLAAFVRGARLAEPFHVIRPQVGVQRAAAVDSLVNCLTGSVTFQMGDNTLYAHTFKHAAQEHLTVIATQVAWIIYREGNYITGFTLLIVHGYDS